MRVYCFAVVYLRVVSCIKYINNYTRLSHTLFYPHFGWCCYRSGSHFHKYRDSHFSHHFVGIHEISTRNQKRLCCSPKKKVSDVAFAANLSPSSCSTRTTLCRLEMRYVCAPYICHMVEGSSNELLLECVAFFEECFQLNVAVYLIFFSSDYSSFVLVEMEGILNYARRSVLSLTLKIIDDIK